MFLTNMKTLELLLTLTMLTGAGTAAEKLQPPPAIDPATGLPIKEMEPEKVFDLNFPGGYPTHLVEAIEKAAMIPLNVIVPEKHERFLLPPLKLRNVTVRQLFEALSQSSVKTEIQAMGPNSVRNVTTRYGFTCSDPTQSEKSIWYFFVDNPTLPVPQATPQPGCRFWQLEPYLNKYQVEDITTAIETGWKMANATPGPKMSFHKETKLLIVVGSPSHLSLVDDVLRELTIRQSTPKDSQGQNAQTAGEKPPKK